MSATGNDKFIREKCLHHYIEEQASRFPSQIALKFEKQSLSYFEMNLRANILARDLIRAGVQADIIVGVCAERSFEMVIALLAILKAGGAYLPIDPSLPEKRIHYMLEESCALLVLGQIKFKEKITSSIRFISIGEYLDPTEAAIENPEVSVTPENLAYLIYTSGSTGMPKGVMNQHDGIVNRLLWMQSEFQMTQEDTVLQKTPYSFDVSVWEFFWPLMIGARLVIARPEGHKDPEYLLNLIDEENVTIVHFVPSMLRIFLESQRMERSDSLRFVICSGEALDVAVHNRFFDLCKGDLYNLYGPTEAAVDVTSWHCRPDKNLSRVPIGFPISNINITIHDENGNEVKRGESGELYISGIGVARGYINKPELTAEKFITQADAQGCCIRFYKTGDLAQIRDDGAVEYLGRIDSQVKISGFRVELEEIESCLEELEIVDQAVVILREDVPGFKRLVGYVKTNTEKSVPISIYKDHLRQKLPEYMVPSHYVRIDEFPLSSNGKLDRKLLPKPVQTRPDISTPYINPRSETEKKLVGLWQEQLDLDRIGIDDSFFEVGGSSLLAIQLISRINDTFGTDYQVLRIFQYPTIAQFADLLDGNARNSSLKKHLYSKKHHNNIEGIAIIGMSGRFPGADSIDELWQNIINEVESITRFTRDQLSPGIDEDLLDNPNYILARGIVNNADLFDASFFGVSPLEAKVMDPQQRVFLEEAWKALEHAGYDSESYPGTIGAFAGVGDNHYYSVNLIGHKDLLDTVGNLTVEYGNQKDYIATRTCYALDLTGPGVSVNTGCSTSLLAVDLAFRALRDYECDIAIAGGSDIGIPQRRGFLYQPSGTFSKDGHCRPFDAEASGTMFCDGVGVVVLKRLEEALEDNDTIYATIIGSAKNNDGSQKISFLAPSVSGQSDVIERAQAEANVVSEDIGYIEAHGTATPIGDPIEIEALTKAFRKQTDKTQFCGIGSIKGNIGHPTIASGVTGLIKAALCLYHEEIPATLNYKSQNPQIDFPSSPFWVVNKRTAWKRGGKKRIAAVSSFGFGGTNVHAVVKEAPVYNESGPSRPVQLFLLSAKTSSSLEEVTAKMGHFLSAEKANVKADAAYTLQTGRRGFSERRFLVVPDDVNPQEAFGKRSPLTTGSRTCLEKEPEIVFMFPGQGSQYINMGKQLYAGEPIFKQAVDQCCDFLENLLGRDLRTVVYPDSQDEKASYEALKDTFFTQPAIFVIEYALSMLLMSWGIKPSILVGHSIGEFVCACLSGVFTLEEALTLVAARGRLVKEMPGGCMLSVKAPVAEVEKYLSESIQLAAVNSPNLCVLSGPDEAINGVIVTLEKEEIPHSLLHTSHAFHSEMMEPVVPVFTEEVAKVSLRTPQIPIVSTVLGRAVSEELTEPSYWGNHVKNPVLFSNAIQYLSERENAVFLEVGPRNTLATLTRQHLQPNKARGIISSMDSKAENNAEYTAVLRAVGQLWLYGYSIDWESFYQNEIRRKIPIPTYQFDRKSYWVDPVVIKVMETGDNDGERENGFSTGASEELTEDKTSGSVEKLVSLFEETSGFSLDDFDEESTFMEMGMDSLLLTQIAYRVSKEFKVNVTFGQLLQEYPNIRLLFEYIDTHKKNLNPSRNVEVSISENEILERKNLGNYEIPATDAQISIWQECKDETRSCLYIDSVRLFFKGDFDKDRFTDSFNKVISNNEILHAVYTQEGTGFRVRKNFFPLYEFHDLRESPEKTQDAFYNDLLLHEHQSPFNLTDGPLIRVHILRKTRDEWIVLLLYHRSICDGWSFDIILKKLSEAYTLGVESKSQTTVFDFHDYVHFLKSRKEEETYQGIINYWNERFDQFRAKTVQPIIKIGSCSTIKTRYREFSIDGDVYRQLKNVSATTNYSVFILMVSMMYSILRDTFGRSNITIGVPIAGQLWVNKHDLIGNCANLVLLNLDLTTKSSFLDIVKATQTAFLNAYDHLVDIESLRVELGDRIPQADFVINNSAAYKEGDLDFPGLEFEYSFNPRIWEKNPLYLDVREDNGTLKLLSYINSEAEQGDVLQTNFIDCNHILRGLLGSLSRNAENYELLHSQPEYELKNVIEINKSSADRLFYFVIGVQMYHELAVHLADIAKCYATYHPREVNLLIGDQGQDEWNIEAFASDYCNIIRQHSQGRPVSIIGLSFGGVVAYDVAKKLKEAGQEVELLIILDTLLLSAIKRKPIEKLMNQIKKSFKRGVPATLKAIKEKIDSLKHNTQTENDMNLLQRIRVYQVATKQFEKNNISHKYKYQGKTLLIKAIGEQNKPGFYFDPKYGWAEYFGDNLFIENTPGTHLEILKAPYAEETANKIKQALENNAI